MELPHFLESLYATLHDFPVLFFFCVHLTVGRTVSLLIGHFLLHLSPMALMGYAWMGDMLNIPFFAGLYELLHRGLRLSTRVASWLDRNRARHEHHRFYIRLARMGPIGVMLLAALPFWGCGMWSSILLAWSLRMERLRGTMYLAVGSIIGTLIVLAFALGVTTLIRMF